MVIAYKTYGSYIVILAAILFIGCEKKQEQAQSAAQGNSPATAQNSQIEVPAGTALWIELQKDLDSSKLKSGDHFSGQIAEDVVLNGKPVIPKGSAVKGRVTESNVARQQGSTGGLSLVLESVSAKGSSYTVSTNAVTLEGVPLQTNPSQHSDSRVQKATESAYIPKHGTLQFFLSSPITVKS